MIQRHLLLLLIIPAMIAACSGAPSAAPPLEQPTGITPAAPDAAQSSVTAPATPDAPAAATDVTALERGRTLEGYHYLGKADAPVTIVEFSDFLCTACAFHAEETEPAIIDAYVATGKARIVYRHLLQLGEDSLRAAEAAACAGDQGKFREMRNAIYRNQAALYSVSDLGATLADLAQTIDLNLDEYSNCVQSRKHRARIEADFRAAQEAGVRSRPVFDIAGARLVGARPFEDFQAIIERR